MTTKTEQSDLRRSIGALMADLEEISSVIDTISVSQHLSTLMQFASAAAALRTAIKAVQRIRT
jgi:hypothetical protein